jgi:hypothetical protein
LPSRRGTSAHDLGGELVAITVEHVLELDAQPGQLPFDEGGAILRAFRT